MNGKLIVIDALDGSGKMTQRNKLYDRLISEGYKIKEVHFPNYESESSALVKMYLNGDFGENPDDVSPYVASIFYAVDRYATYMKNDFGKDYKDGRIILLDRYVTANMIHQAGKISNLAEKQKFLDWLYDLEFRIFGIPKPDMVLFLDMPPEYSVKLMENRENKFSHTNVKDIHERNFEYLKQSYENACYVAEKYGWHKISCIDGDRIRSIDEVHEDIYDVVKTELEL